MNFEKTIDRVSNICIEAGHRIMEIYNSSEDFNVEHKSDNTPLTIADKSSNEIICNGLKDLEQLYPVISEENKLKSFEERRNYEYAWLVDPLDGTKEFIKRNGEFTVNVALIHQGKAIGGVVYVPAVDKLFYGIKNHGSFVKSGGKTTRLECNSFDMKQKALRVVCSRSHLNPVTEAFLASLDEPKTIARGSSLKFLVLAEGKAELYPRLAPTMEWDTAAAQIILEEAGGMVLDVDQQEALKYNKPNLLNPHFIARAKLG